MNKKAPAGTGAMAEYKPELKKDKKRMQDFFSKINLPLYLFLDPETDETKFLFYRRHYTSIHLLTTHF